MKYLAIFAVFLLVLAGCGGQTADNKGVKQAAEPAQQAIEKETKDTGITEQETRETQPETTTPTQTQTEAVQQNTAKTAEPEEVVIEMTATGPSIQDWSFTPSTVTVKEGQKVKLLITVPEGDTTHGFALPAFGINKRLSPGTTTTVEFVADKKGNHNFFCSVPCGLGHSGMRGQLVVE